MAHESCKSQIAVLEMNRQSVPQRWTSMHEGSNTARRQCSAWDIELSAIRRAKVLASRESGYRVAHSRQVVRCHPMETLEHLDSDSETDALLDSYSFRAGYQGLQSSVCVFIMLFVACVLPLTIEGHETEHVSVCCVICRNS